MTCALARPLILALAAGCSAIAGDQQPLSAAERAEITDTIRNRLVQTYVFDGQNPVPRFLSLYADTGRVVSAASGSFSITRDSVQAALTAFWLGAGQYMRDPTWTWGTWAIDVLSRDAAVVTARYTVPHWTPDGNPHVLGGAWTSVWTRRQGRWVIVQEHLSDVPRAAAERVESQLPVRPPDGG
ncbi:MAG TPA: nuclear transport factor 2 family protein [Gemmatimonadaceae bacterium]